MLDEIGVPDRGAARWGNHAAATRAVEQRAGLSRSALTTA
jgi:hypothetical protein